MSVSVYGSSAKQKAGEQKVNEGGCFARPKTGAGAGLREGEGCHKKGLEGVVSPAALISSAGIIFDNLSEHKMFRTRQKQGEMRICGSAKFDAVGKLGLVRHPPRRP